MLGGVNGSLLLFFMIHVGECDRPPSDAHSVFLIAFLSLFFLFLSLSSS